MDMEGRRDGAAGAAAAALQGMRWRRRRRCGGGSGSGDESDGSSGGGVELSLRLRTGDSSSGAPPAALAVAEEEQLRHHAAAAAAEAKRNMTIFYNGRVCAVDVTEVQARAIISMANEEMIKAAAADHPRQQRRHHLQDSGSSSSSSVRVRPADQVAKSAPTAGPSGSGHGIAALAAAAPVIDQAAVVSGLSMKRSLQLFLHKRKARAAGAVAPPYAGGRHAQAIMRH